MTTMNTNAEVESTGIRLYPIFGPERAPYLRMIYGTKSAPWSGLTPGRFYDKRALPVPYLPLERTWFQIDLPSAELDGVTARAKIYREGSVEEGAADTLSVLLTYPVSVFSLRLGQGLNRVQLINPSTGVEIAETMVTSVRYASFTAALARQIQANVWQRLDLLENDIFSEDATALTAPLFNFDEHLSPAPNLNRVMRSILVNAFMNYPTATRAFTDLGQALLSNAPLVTIPSRRALDDAWLGGVESASDHASSRRIFIWPPNAISARYANFSFLGIASGKNAYLDRLQAQLEDREHDFRQLANPISYDYQDVESWIELQSSVEENEFNFWPHNRTMALIQAPGLWDYERSYFDSSSTFDSGHEFNSASKSLDPANSGYVGITATPRRPLDPTGEIPTGVVALSANEAVATDETSVAGFSSVETFSWDVEEVGTLGSVFGAVEVININYPVVAGGSGLGLHVLVTDVSSGHTHLASTLTRTQVASVKGGTPLAMLSQLPEQSDYNHHQHSLTISWRDGWVIDFDDNHGHGVHVTEV